MHSRIDVKSTGSGLAVRFAAAITALLLAACQSAAPSGVSTPASAPGGGGGVLDQVRARGTLRVATTEASPPWNFLNPKNQVDGYDADVSHELVTRMGIPNVEFVGSNFQDFIPGIQTDKFDLVVAGQTITDERKQQVDFSEPYEVNGWSAFVASNNDAIKTEADLAGKRIAVTSGGTQEQYARKSIPNADVKTYENATLALTDVGIGRADAYLGSRFVGAYLAEQNGLKVKPLAGILNQEINAISMKKGETALKAEVDRALEGMMQDGTLTRISTKWLGGLDMTEQLRALPKS